MTAESSASKNVKVVSLTQEQRRSRSLWSEAGAHVLHDKLTMFALIVLFLLTLVCIFMPPFIESTQKVSATRTNVVDRYKPPGFKNYILGTDQIGRDQLARLMYGGRVSLGVAYGASLLSLTIGILIGMIAGYYGGRTDEIVIWIISTLSSIPTLFLLILVSVIFSPSPELLVLLLGLLGWIGTCRLVRGEVMALKEREFMVAARALGAPTWRMMLHQLLPNLISLAIVSLTIDAGSLILTESALSYLGLGITPPTPSWGNMLTEARKYLTTGTHLIVWPGIMIFITVLCFFVVGDGLRDAFDPRKAGK